MAEVLAPKAGNVHSEAAFDDLTWLDFVASAIATAPILDGAAEDGVGQTVLACVRATQEAVGSNTNLGIILLLAPLCAVPIEVTLVRGIHEVLAAMNDQDTRAVYEAIRLADPGGLGHAPEGDVHQVPTLGLIEAMKLTAGRDTLAQQYINDFHDVIGRLAPRLSQRDQPLDRAIIRAHLEQMAHEPDSLIGRKCGEPTARASQDRAAAVLEAGWPDSPLAVKLFHELDAWLRAEGNRRNPGTSADLVTAGLFTALREGWIKQPFEWSLPVSL